MIVNDQSTSNFLKKDIPSYKLREEDISGMWENISSYLTDNVDATNTLNDDYLKLLDLAATNSQYALNRLGTVSSLLADLYSISGASSTSMDVFGENVKYSSTGATVDRDALNVHLDSVSAKVYVPKTIKVSSRNGQLGNSREYDTSRYDNVDNIVGTYSRLEIESFESELVCAISIDLGQEYPLNNISFGMTNFGIRLPVIDSIEVSANDKMYSKKTILTSNSTSIDLDNFRFDDNSISLPIEECRARYIRINLLQNYSYSIEESLDKRFPIGINGLRLAFNSSVETGSVIIGPLQSNSEILKVSIDSEMKRYNLEEGNVQFEVSHNLDTWIPVENSKIFDPDSDISKVVNYNTIDTTSMSTLKPVHEIYLRISMSSVDASHISASNVNVSRYRSVVDSGNRSILIDSDYSDINVYKLLNFKHGGRLTSPSGRSVRLSSNISELTSDGTQLVRSVGQAEGNYIDITENSAVFDTGVTAVSKFDPCFIKKNEIVVCEPSNAFDPYDINIFKFSKPIYGPLNIESTDRKFKRDDIIPVLPVNAPAGKYYLYVGEDILEINISEGFFYSSSELVYFVPDDTDTAVIYDEIGNKFADVSIVDNILYLGSAFSVDLPDITDLDYQMLYPYKELGPKEFAIKFGQIVFGSYYKGLGNIHRVTKESVAYTPISGLNSTKKIILDKAKQVKSTYSLEGNDLKTVVKLNHTNIIKDTLGFDLSKASVNTFIKEVSFVDGYTEFKISDKYTQVNNYNKSTIALHVNYADDGEIEFSTLKHLFINRVYSEDELIEEGDWMISFDPSPVIILPENVRTSDIVDVEIMYNIQGDKISTSGLYSVDYRRGILHTAAPIDHKTIVSYQYAYIFAEYEALETLEDTSYVVSGSSVGILNTPSEDEEYLVITSVTTEDNEEYRASPILSNIKINIITADDFL